MQIFILIVLFLLTIVNGLLVVSNVNNYLTTKFKLYIVAIAINAIAFILCLTATAVNFARLML